MDAKIRHMMPSTLLMAAVVIVMGACTRAGTGIAPVEAGGTTGSGGGQPGGAQSDLPPESASGSSNGDPSNVPPGSSQSRQCSRKAFKVGESEYGASQLYTPRSILVTILRNRAGAVTTSSCMGVLGLRKMTIETLADGTVISPVSAYLPHIMLARHCVVADDDAPISGLSFKTLAGKEVETSYDFDGKVGTTKLTGRSEPGLWVLDPREALREPAGDECTAAAKAEGASAKACFTFKKDRVRIVTAIEQKLDGGNFPIDAAKISQLATIKGNALVWHENGDEAALWSELYKDATEGQPAMALLARTLEYGAASREKFIADLDAKLEKITITRLLHQADDASPQARLIERKSGQSWGDLLSIVGQEKDKRFKVEVFGLTDTNMALRPGDSGTIMVGHFADTMGGPLGFRAYTEVLGSLSTVGGEPVCTGDDLLCCDKI